MQKYTCVFLFILKSVFSLKSAWVGGLSKTYGFRPLSVPLGFIGVVSSRLVGPAHWGQPTLVSLQREQSCKIFGCCLFWFLPLAFLEASQG